MLSKSRNVRSYVKAVLKERKAKAALDKLEPRWRRLTNNHFVTMTDAIDRRKKLSGGQMAEADRLLAMDPAVLALMAKPCNVRMSKVRPEDLYGLPVPDEAPVK